jgi:prolyl oligopeptidase PreP (S9A serine peptidase family)
MNTRKFAARLLDVTAPDNVIMRVYQGEGHGAHISYADRVEHRIEELTFFEHTLR